MLATEYPPAKGYGLARYASELSAALASDGVGVDVVTLNLLEGAADYLENGVRVHLMTEQLDFQSFEWVSDTILNNVRILERAVQVCEDNRFDVVAAHDWLGALAAKALKTIYDVPLVLTIHDTEIGKRFGQLNPQQQYIAETEAWAARTADKIITTTKFMKKEIVTHYKAPKQKIVVIPCGVNASAFETNCDLKDFRRIFAPDEAKIVLFVGRLTPIKGPQVLLEAAGPVIKASPGATFIFAGEGVLTEDLKKQAPSLPEGGNVIFTGHLGGKALAATYRVADCLVVPSTYEPFGLVALEGMVCGTPVVASDVGGLSEIVENGVNGLKAPPNDPQSLASGIIRLLREPEFSRQLAGSALRRCSEHFTWENAARKVRSVYETVKAVP